MTKREGPPRPEDGEPYGSYVKRSSLLVPLREEIEKAGGSAARAELFDILGERFGVDFVNDTKQYKEINFARLMLRDKGIISPDSQEGWWELVGREKHLKPGRVVISDLGSEDRGRYDHVLKARDTVRDASRKLMPQLHLIATELAGWQVADADARANLEKRLGALHDAVYEARLALAIRNQDEELIVKIEKLGRRQGRTEAEAAAADRAIAKLRQSARKR